MGSLKTDCAMFTQISLLNHLATSRRRSIHVSGCLIVLLIRQPEIL